MNRKLICLILSAVMFLGLLAACADASADEAESVTSLEFAEAEPEVKLGALTDNVIPLAETPAISSVIKPVASGKSVKENSKALIDYSNINDGYVMIKTTIST